MVAKRQKRQFTSRDVKIDAPREWGENVKKSMCGFATLTFLRPHAPISSRVDERGALWF